MRAAIATVAETSSDSPSPPRNRSPPRLTEEIRHDRSTVWSPSDRTCRLGVANCGIGGRRPSPDPTESLDPEVWPDLLAWPQLRTWLMQDSGASTPCAKAFKPTQQLPGYAESDQRRLRLQHEVTLLLLMGGVEPLTAAEIEDLGLKTGMRARPTDGGFPRRPRGSRPIFTRKSPIAWWR
ncbi:MAG: hypothetical protein IPK63_15370 [Candidatus Competibacteraceae bacterium]|nr:hypothetical protein [Candidatus Competibacteraceae bacterium]